VRPTGPDIGHRKPWESGREETAQIVVTFDDNQFAMRLFGRHSEHLALIERRLDVVVDQRGNHVTIEGQRENCDQARLALETLYEQLRAGHEITSGDVEGAIRHAVALPARAEESGGRPGFEQFRLRKRLVQARTPGQDSYLRALKKNTLAFATGPAGTGKTWLAVAHAVHLLERREVDRIVLSRPAVEAGERLGFLPGDMREKVDPYLRPIYDAFYELMDRGMVERALQSGEIEIAPLAFMRGRTLSNAAVILDEAQNTTPMQMKMFLTRLGEHSRMIVTGDPSQVDLPAGQASGLAEAVNLIGGLSDVAVCEFSAADVVRHELVSRIVNAYDAADAAKKAPRVK
jgi:phosphate starvation-inducible protein PhoH and related proteins